MHFSSNAGLQIHTATLHILSIRRDNRITWVLNLNINRFKCLAWGLIIINCGDEQGESSCLITFPTLKFSSYCGIHTGAFPFMKVIFKIMPRWYHQRMRRSVVTDALDSLWETVCVKSLCLQLPELMWNMVWGIVNQTTLMWGLIVRLKHARYSCKQKQLVLTDSMMNIRLDCQESISVE